MFDHAQVIETLKIAESAHKKPRAKHVQSPGIAYRNGVNALRGTASQGIY